jgi:hypothetical protein
MLFALSTQLQWKKRTENRSSLSNWKRPQAVTLIFIPDASTHMQKTFETRDIFAKAACFAD